MAETKIYIDDAIDMKLRELAMKRFGYGKGSISKAAEEAIEQWIGRTETVEKRLSELVEKAKEDKRVIAVILFGSYARKEYGYRDVDVALLPAEDTDFKNVQLEYLSSISPDRLIDISILNELPLNVQSRLFDEGIILYVRDKDRLHGYNMEMVRQWSDFERLYQLQIGGAQ